MRDILALDVGTTAFKMGLFGPDLEKKLEITHPYAANFYGGGKADIEPEKWWGALQACCNEVRGILGSVGVISLSVTTPSAVPMADDGSAVGAAILFCDGRSREQARRLRELVGEDKFLAETCNLPVSGGSTLCSIMWVRENLPEVWNAAKKWGHCNTYMTKRLTGEWVVDPNSISISGMYNSVRNDLTWNQDVLAAGEMPESKLPTLMPSDEKVGRILPHVAAELGLPHDCDVLCGANDATLAALSGGLTASGGISNIAGTCEITNVCLDKPIGSRNFSIRCHVVPGHWLTFRIMNTGGKALEWFHSAFCKDMTGDAFYGDYMPSVLEDFFANDPDSRESELPDYVPYLQGSRYSVDRLTASFAGLTLETTRENLLLSLIRGNALYQGEHLREVGALVKLGQKVMVTGGGAKIRGLIDAKKRWMGDFEYEFQDQSSLLGAAMLGRSYLNERV
ncbi:MAG: FGGY family carbohydrate kinase [Armatimonadetes bacterium]|nr:FGGY family carbohydrate kinase [Armatimonadota bacterium]